MDPALELLNISTDRDLDLCVLWRDTAPDYRWWGRRSVGDWIDEEDYGSLLSRALRRFIDNPGATLMAVGGPADGSIRLDLGDSEPTVTRWLTVTRAELAEVEAAAPGLDPIHYLDAETGPELPPMPAAAPSSEVEAADLDLVAVLHDQIGGGWSVWEPEEWPEVLYRRILRPTLARHRAQSGSVGLLRGSREEGEAAVVAPDGSINWHWRWRTRPHDAVLRMDQDARLR